jgi:alkylation response protein AidB-like acyl-CoA dehydrogenase
MFIMMNAARLGVGLQGLAQGEVAYQNAVAYARERRQGRALHAEARDANAKADPLFVHPDVRRMLMEMRAFNQAARALILWGALIAAAGLVGTMLSYDLYGITIGFALASLGFGFTRPGFTAGASLAVPLAEQGSVAGVITAANGISYVLAPTIGIALYGFNHDLPFAAFALLLLGLAVFGRGRLDD